MSPVDESPAPRGYFPGSRQPLPASEVKKKSKPKDPVTWDARPVVKIVNNERTEFFTIGALAAALGRDVITVRRWQTKGLLPEARFRMPDKNGIRGRRLYTRAQIEAILQVADAHGILQPVRVQWDKHPTFADDVRRAWSQ